jgi:hypothetical protein
MVGFLHPIDSTGYQIGWVDFEVTPDTGLVSGTEITNQAFVNFDGVGPWNPAPLEAPYLNTIDNGTPSSYVLPEAVHLDSTAYLISWTGEDDPLGSGIVSYTLYISEHPDSTFNEWIINTPDTSAIFTGELYQTYYFYSIARDGVGFIEDPPEIYDLELYITQVSVEESFAINNGLYIYPNPFNKKTTIAFSNPEKKEYTLTIYDISGKDMLYIPQISSDRIEIEKGSLPKGVYIVEIKGDKVFRGKMVVK